VRVVTVDVLTSYEYEPRQQRRCTVCGKRRLTTRQRWRVEDKEQEAFICNPCLIETPPWIVVKSYKGELWTSPS